MEEHHTHNPQEEHHHTSMTDHNHQDHGGMHHHQGMVQDFKKRLYISSAITIPVIFLSEMIQQLFGFQFSFKGDSYILFLFSSIVFFYGGGPFLKGLINELREKVPGMMTLIAVAITIAYVYSAAVVLGLPGMDFFWELVSLIDIMLLGHLIEMKSIAGASKSLELLIQMMPNEAHLVEGETIKDIQIKSLKPNDLILIKPGEKIPADGIIEEGNSNINESMLTGESKPVEKGKADKVIGGSINGNGALKVKVEYIGENSYLSKVIGLVEEAQKTKSKTQRLADQAAFWLTIAALSAGAITLLVWLYIGQSFSFALERMVTVMVISCPHALGLAVPLVVAISTAISAQKGLLIKNRTAFENARRITTVVFDKTGTLTKGIFGVTRFKSYLPNYTSEDILKIAAALEQKSEHPIAVGILSEIKKTGAAIPQVENFRAITGKGIEAELEGKKIRVVSPGFLKDQDILVPQDTFSSQAETIVFVMVDNSLAGFISLADQVREESQSAIQHLRSANIKAIMITGDNKAVAESVSKELQLDGFFAEVLPHQKLEKIKQLQENKEFVAMAGDGVNDAPALAQADIGIAIGSGTDVAAETADIVLVNSNPKDIVSLILFGRATYRKIVQNLIWAVGYNIIAIPVAAGLFYKHDIVITPAFGAVLMSLSTVIVAINAQLLKERFN